MEGVCYCIGTSSPSTARLPPLLCRTRTILPQAGPHRRMVHNGDRDPVAGIFALHNACADVLLSMPIQDTHIKSTSISSSSHLENFAICSRNQVLAQYLQLLDGSPNPTRAIRLLMSGTDGSFGFL